MAVSKTISLCVLTGGLALIAGCSGGSKGNPANRGDFKVNRITTGHGQIYPYRIRRVDGDGNPTDTIINIESIDDLQSNVNSNNGVLPVALFPTTATLPDSSPGNHFLQIEFSHLLDVTSILSDQVANATTSSGLTTAISLIAYNPADESTTVLRGRGFVGGETFINNAGVMERVRAVSNNNGTLQIDHPIANGFPMGFTGDVDLVAPSTFVFVADTDNNLSTLETFPPAASALIRVLVSNSVRNSEGKVLEQETCTATTVGTDPNPPDVLGYDPARTLAISPGNGVAGVDPSSTILISFNKPVQPPDVGTFFTRTTMTPQPGGVSLNVTQAASTYTILYYADPFDYSDLCNYRVRPAYVMQGDTAVTVNVNATSVRGLSGMTLGRNAATTFTTGKGTGTVNAPVSPDALYIGVGGANPGVAVLDLNGFGQGTNGLMPDENGNPTLTPLDTNWANNPNVGAPGVVPSLSVGTSQLDAGSSGPLTLTEDTRGNTLLLQAPLIGEVTDIHIGPPLDLVFNSSNINVNAGGANQVNSQGGAVQPGNGIAIQPHPNPPRLRFPPPNVSRAIFGEEPTDLRSGNNQLVPSNFPQFRQHLVVATYVGPPPPPPSPPPPATFQPFNSRQQIGHFLYVLDRLNRQVLVVNSNRFTVLDTIRLSDPVNMSFSPSLGILAVANFSASTVSFINTDPRSTQFNTVIAETRVATGPTKVVWQPDGEAIAVLSPSTSQLAILSGFDFSEIKTVSGNLVEPIGVACTERYVQSGNSSGVWYAYVLNADGTVAVYESGPDGVNGIGFNDMIGIADPVFRRPAGIMLAWTSTLGGVWVYHVDEGGIAVVSLLELTSSPQGQLQTTQNSGGFVLPPTFRQKAWSVTQKFGGSDPLIPLNQRLSGTTVADIAFDEMLNSGFGTNQQTPNNGLTGVSILGHSAKARVFLGPGGAAGTLVPYVPTYMFVALRDTGKIDVFELETRLKVRSIDVPGVNLLASYWRQ